MPMVIPTANTSASTCFRLNFSFSEAACFSVWIASSVGVVVILQHLPEFLDAGYHHLNRYLVQPALWNDHVCVAACRFHELQVHGPDGVHPLVDHRVWRSPPFGCVTL